MVKLGEHREVVASKEHRVAQVRKEHNLAKEDWKFIHKSNNIFIFEKILKIGELNDERTI